MLDRGYAGFRIRTSQNSTSTTFVNKGKRKGRRAGPPALFARSYKISLGRYMLPLTVSEEELFFSVPLSPDSPFLVVVSASVPPL